MMTGFSGMDGPKMIDRTEADCKPIGENEVFEREYLKKINPRDWKEKEQPFSIMPVFNNHGNLDFRRSEIYRECKVKLPGEEDTQTVWKKVSGVTRGTKLRQYQDQIRPKEAA